MGARVTALWLLAAALPAIAVGAPLPASAGGTTNGGLLYSNYLLNPTSNVKTAIPSAFFSKPTQFAPDGASVAFLTNRCEAPCDDFANDSVVDVEVRSNVGDSNTLGTLRGQGESVTWSPDGESLAVLVRNSDFSSGRIVRVNVAGGVPVTIAASTPEFGIDPGSMISWNPTSNEIAFVGTEYFAPDQAWLVHSRQLYVVDAVTKSQARFNTQQVEGCGAPDQCPGVQFADPDWAPGGTRLVVDYTYDPDINDFVTDAPDELSVATISAGDEFASPVAETGSGSSYTGPFWSPDGTKILYSREVGGELTGGIVPVDGGAVRDLESFWFLDWQACPAGVCARWAAPPTRVDSTISLNYTTSTLVRTNGQVVPNRAGQTVTVTLQKLQGRSWVTLATKSAALSANSRYVIQFPRRDIFTCRAVARYPGDARTKPATATKVFSC
jgi:Tol biopolymer transport system component